MGKVLASPREYQISSFREGHGSSLSFFMAPILRQYLHGVSMSSSIFTSVKKDLGLKIS